MTIYSLEVLLSWSGTSLLFHVQVCCFLTCTQVSQEAGQVVWYSRLFKNFPQFVVIHTVKCFGTVNKSEVVIFLELSCFFVDSTDVGNLISCSSGFSWSTFSEAPNCYNLATSTLHPLQDMFGLPKTYLKRCNNSSIYSSWMCGMWGKWAGHICVWILSFKSIIWRVDYFIYPSISLFSF